MDRAAISFDVYCLGYEISRLGQALIMKQAWHDGGDLGVLPSDVFRETEACVKSIRIAISGLTEDASDFSPKRAAVLTASVMQAVQVITEILSLAGRNRVIDSPDNTTEELADASLGVLYPAIKLMQDFAAQDVLFEKWWLLGTAIARAKDVVLKPESQQQAQESAMRLYTLTGYPWLKRLADVLSLPVGSKALKRCREPYVDREPGVISIPRLDTVIRKNLAENVPAQVLLEIDDHGVTLFGTYFSKQAFSPTEWELLICLAQHAGDKVERRDLSSAANQKTGSPTENVAIHIMNLRNKLKPAFDASTAPELLPVASHKDLINGYSRAGGGPYALVLHTDQVEINVSTCTD